MKKTYLCFILISISALINCRDIDKLLTFNIKNENNFVVPASVQLYTPFGIPTPDIQTNSEQEFRNNKTKKDLVKDVRLTSLSLEIISPANKSFSFMKSIKIYISAEGLSEILLAHQDAIPDNVGNKLDLIPSKEKLDEYIKKSSYNVRTEVVTDEAFVHDIEIKSKMNFKVTADLL